MRAKARVGAAGLAVLVVLALSGCFSALHAAQRFVAPGDMRDPEPGPTSISTVRPQASNVVLPLDTEIGTAAIVSPRNLVSGFLTIDTDKSGGFVVNVSSFKTADDRQLSLVMTADPVSPTSTCNQSTAKQQIELEPPAIGVSRLVLAPNAAEFRRGDPGYLKAFLLLDPQEATPGCLSAIAGVATIRWTLPDMNPGFLVYDTGPTGGARGVTTMADGRPESYEVVKDDLLPEIAARFGITTGDLLWLNPSRSDELVAHIDEVFNLSAADR